MVIDRRRAIAVFISLLTLPAAFACNAVPVAAADLLAQLKSGEKTMLVGTDATFPPFEFTETNGQKNGFDIELVSMIARRSGIKRVEFKQVPFGELVSDLTANHIDLAASAIYITPERAQVVSFSEPYFTGGLSVMVKPSDDAIRSEQDLAGKRIAVQVGTKSVNWLKEHIPSAQLVIVQTNDQMFQSLQSGRADAVVTGLPAARYYIKTHGGAKLAPFLLTHEEYGLAMRKDDPALLAAVNDALTTFKRDGTLKRLESKWFGSGA